MDFILVFVYFRRKYSKLKNERMTPRESSPRKIIYSPKICNGTEQVEKYQYLKGVLKNEWLCTILYTFKYGCESLFLTPFFLCKFI